MGNTHGSFEVGPDVAPSDFTSMLSENEFFSVRLVNAWNRLQDQELCVSAKY